MTYRELVRQAADVSDRERLLLGITGWSFGAFLLHEDEEADPGTQAVFTEGIERLRAHEPLQYILREAPFYGRSFYVDSRVLIPRFDTEILLEEALRESDKAMREGRNRLSVLDLCTGSGCIAITLQLERPGFLVTASDLSEDALEVARTNAGRLLGNTETVRFVHSDLFEHVNGTFDLIVTNPPYIRTEDISALDPEVREHEPVLALDGGTDGLDFVRKIASSAVAFLSESGRILMEIGDEEGEDALRVFRKEGFEDIVILKDLSGRDRVLSARKGRNG